jgi:hypothetical protein
MFVSRPLGRLRTPKLASAGNRGRPPAHSLWRLCYAPVSSRAGPGGLARRLPVGGSPAGTWRGSEPPGPRLRVTPGAGMSRCVCVVVVVCVPVRATMCVAAAGVQVQLGRPLWSDCCSRLDTRRFRPHLSVPGGASWHHDDARAIACVAVLSLLHGGKCDCHSCLSRTNPGPPALSGDTSQSDSVLAHRALGTSALPILHMFTYKQDLPFRRGASLGWQLGTCLSNEAAMRRPEGSAGRRSCASPSRSFALLC